MNTKLIRKPNPRESKFLHKVEDIKNFIEDKDTFWKLLKQREYASINIIVVNHEFNKNLEGIYLDLGGWIG